MNASKKITALLIVIAIALSGCTASGGELSVTPACSAGAITPGFTSLWSTWQGVSFLAALTVWAVSILAYVIGYALDHEKARLWAKEQMQEAVVAMVILIFAAGFVSFLCTIDMKSLGLDTGCGAGSSCNLAEVAFNQLSAMYTTIMQGYLLVIGINSALAAAASMTIGFAPGGIGPTFAPLAFLAEVANAFLLATIALITSAVMTLSQMILLKMTASVFTILFPVGVILRSFGATRGFGGGLIAIALGFFLFYPLLVVLFYGSVNGEISSDYNGLSNAFQSAGASPSDPSWFLSGNLLGFFTAFIGKTIMGAFIIPLIMFMVLISFIKGLSVALGEEVDVSNLTRLI